MRTRPIPEGAFIFALASLLAVSGCGFLKKKTDAVDAGGGRLRGKR